MRKGYVSVSIKQLDRMKQDIMDMQASHCTSFSRCQKCGRLHDSKYCCIYCGHDNSSEE